MAEALIGRVSEKLLSVVEKEFATISGIKEKAEKLSSTLDLIKAVLEDAEKKQITEKSVKVWLQQLKDAAYELDDILDECSIQSHRLSDWRSFFKPKHIKLRHRLGKELKEITERFDQIAEAKNKFSLSEGVRERPSDVAEWRQTSSIIPHHQVYGRDGDKEKIVQFLRSQAQCSDSLSVYPIVGLGGVGKTTLTQLVYNDEKVSSHFDTKIWVCVSEIFSVKRILCAIIQSITKEEKFNNLNLDEIEREVLKLLQSKRYLLILDDVWKANQQLQFGLSQCKWDQLQSVLSCRSKGASILVSTRDEEVATIMGTCQAHHLSALSNDDCWLLFKQNAFRQDREECEELETIGREIVEKCRGSPLAAKILGGVVQSKSTKEEWIDVRESWLWALEDEILPALRLSYFHLTPTLKQCFAFCAMFPKDTNFSKEELIHLWMANGFISSTRSLEVENVGNAIWDELYKKSFFQDFKKDDLSGDIFFTMHDLVHDLAQSVMGQECLIMENTNMADFPKSTHHISFSCNLDVGVLVKVKSLRTLYQLELPGNKKCSGYFPTKCSLRVLRMSSFELSSLGNLIHLRYLELHESETKTLPDSICSLQKLEILKLIDCWGLRCLPKHLSCLRNLRHLVIDDWDSLSDMFPNIGNLSYLRTLSKYIVSLEQGHSLSELQNLKLGGKLEITGLEFVESKGKAGEAKLREKEDLRQLCLSWKRGFCRNSTTAEQVLEGLEPHPNLKTLRIQGYEGFHFPRWIGDLTSLVTLQLCGGRECKQLPSLGKLPLLRELEIMGPMEIVYVDEDESYEGVEVMAFPSLEGLMLSCLPKLERLLNVERRNMCPRLSYLYIDGCPELEWLPCHPSIESLNFSGPNKKSLISGFIGLTFLGLNGDENTTMTSFPEGMMRNLTCLKRLTISCFKELKELPNELFYLKALERLEIFNCPKLECLPEQVWEGLCSLQQLWITRCEGLRSLPEDIRHLTSLRSLSIDNCEGLRSLPEGIGHLTSLRYLSICQGEGLRSLPEGIRHLTSLQCLVIANCEGLRSLPEGIRHLTSLKSLSIEGCPTLIKRCKKGTGQDWDKIAHVPHVHICNDIYTRTIISTG